MPNHSTWIGIGHLGKDAEVRDAGSQKVVSFSIAVTRKRKETETTTWFRCQYWGERAVKVAQYLTKGKPIQVVGELYEREYEKDGAKRRSLEVEVQTLTLLGGRGDGEARNAAPMREATTEQDEPPF